MNFFDNPFQAVAEAVQAVVAPVVQVVADVTKPISQPIASVSKELSRGDVGRYIGETGTNFSRIVTGGAQGTAELMTGNFSGAKNTLGRTVGSAGNVLTYGSQNFIGRDQTAQAVLRYEPIAKNTLGLSDDYAGFTRGGSTLSGSGEISSADLNSSARLISKGVGAGLAYGAYQGLSVGAKATAGGLAGAVAKKDPAEAINAIAPGAGDIINQYLPQLPTAPSWLPVPDLSSVYDSFINPAKNGAPGAGSSTPFNQSGATSADALPLASTPQAKTMIVLAVLVAGFIIYKKGYLK